MVTAVEVEAFTDEEAAVIAAARRHFWYFLENVFIRSFDGEYFTNDQGQRQAFSFARIHREWALIMQYNPRLCLMAPRLHLKSTVVLAFAFWKMFRTEQNREVECIYFSYKKELAQEKVAALLGYIQANPYCRFWKNLKSASETQISMSVDFGDGPVGRGSMISAGILSATRGRHPQVTICDDILSDFANPLSPTEIDKINRIFRQAVMSLPPNEDDPLFVIGTPQSYEDILHLLSGLEEYWWGSYPAIIDEKNEVMQWPEKFSYARLKRVQRAVGPSAFEVEYQLAPVSVTDQFFTRADILGVIDAQVMNWTLGEAFDRGDLSVYGGFDVGRFVHPSHVTVLLELPSGTLVQVYSQFLDKMRYNAQVNTLNSIADTFKLARGYFDATYNALEDRGLRNVWRGRAFNRKLKADMATLFEKRIVAQADEPGIILQNDLRQLRQLITVDKALKAATTVDGHGDAFWSNGLAIKAAADGPSIIDISTPSVLPRAGVATSRLGQTWVRQLGANG